MIFITNLTIHTFQCKYTDAANMHEQTNIIIKLKKVDKEYSYTHTTAEYSYADTGAILEEF